MHQIEEKEARELLINHFINHCNFPEEFAFELVTKHFSGEALAYALSHPYTKMYTKIKSHEDVQILQCR